MLRPPALSCQRGSLGLVENSCPVRTDELWTDKSLSPLNGIQRRSAEGTSCIEERDGGMIAYERFLGGDPISEPVEVFLIRMDLEEHHGSEPFSWRT